MKALETWTAVIEAGAGLALLALPSASTMLLLGTPLESAAAVSIARVGGAGLLALGTACWLVRSDTESKASRALVVAMLVYNFLVAAVLALASLGSGLQGALLWPAVVLHTAMGIWCITRFVAADPADRMT